MVSLSGALPTANNTKVCHVVYTLGDIGMISVDYIKSRGMSNITFGCQFKDAHLISFPNED